MSKGECHQAYAGIQEVARILRYTVGQGWDELTEEGKKLQLISLAEDLETIMDGMECRGPRV